MARKKEKSGFLSAFGTTFEIWKKIVEAVMAKGGNDDDLRRVLTEKGLSQKVAEVIMAGNQKVAETYKVIVDYGKSLKEMILAGKYNWFNDDINDKHFPLQGAGQHEVELELVHLNQSVTTKEVLAQLNEQGLEPAKIEHLLAFGAMYPDVQREFLVLALGSVWVDDHGRRYYPYLDCLDGRRELRLRWRDGDDPWGGTCRFLAFRK